MNRCLTKSMKNKIPQEAWKGMNHSVSHLKFFGCVAYAYVPDSAKSAEKEVRQEGTKMYFCWLF